MKGKIIFGAGLAAGYVLGSRSGRSAYERLKTKANELWHSPTVQHTVDEAAELARHKGSELADKAAEAVKDASAAAAAKLKGPGSENRGSAPTTAPAASAPDAVSNPAVDEALGHS